jgi:hypothetical protein
LNEEFEAGFKSSMEEELDKIELAKIDKEFDSRIRSELDEERSGGTGIQATNTSASTKIQHQHQGPAPAKASASASPSCMVMAPWRGHGTIAPKGSQK